MRGIIVKEQENLLMVRRIDETGMPMELLIVYRYKNQYYLISKARTMINAENIFNQTLKEII
jgi:hypothetical protein